MPAHRRRLGPTPSPRGQRGPAGRTGVPAARGASAAQRRRAVDVPGRGRRGPPVTSATQQWSTRSSARPGRRGRGGRCASWARRRRRRGGRERCAGGSSAPGARGAASRVEVEVSRPARAHPSRRERMSTPTLGLGWKDVAFSGSSRPCSATRSTSPKSGAGIRTATAAAVGDARASASSTEWCVADVGAGCAQRRQQVARAGPRRRARSGCAASASDAPVVAVGRDQRVGAQGRDRLLRGRSR